VLTPLTATPMGNDHVHIAPVRSSSSIKASVFDALVQSLAVRSDVVWIEPVPRAKVHNKYVRSAACYSQCSPYLLPFA
jgi:hypothetical protein